MFSVRVAAWAALVGCAALWTATATAQVYRIVGPDGKVTFSDRPPPDGRATQARTMTMQGDAGAEPPLELRTTAARYPFTLYSSRDCGPCAAARTFLTQRGVPFAERLVATHEDVQALQKIAGEARVPFATLGGQHLKGYSEAEWSAYLDAAGYPKTSQLPAGYRNPEPTPLVALQPPPAPAAAGADAPSEPPARAATPLPPVDAPGNPTGIRF